MDKTERTEPTKQERKALSTICLSPYFFALSLWNPFLVACGWKSILAVFLIYPLVGARWCKPTLAVGFPIGAALIVLAVLNSAFQCLRRGGVVWRDTFYSLESLKKGMAYKR